MRFNNKDILDNIGSLSLFDLRLLNFINNKYNMSDQQVFDYFSNLKNKNPEMYDKLYKVHSLYSPLFEETYINLIDLEDLLNLNLSASNYVIVKKLLDIGVPLSKINELTNKLGIDKINFLLNYSSLLSNKNYILNDEIVNMIKEISFEELFSLKYEFSYLGSEYSILLLKLLHDNGIKKTRDVINETMSYSLHSFLEKYQEINPESFDKFFNVFKLTKNLEPEKFDEFYSFDENVLARASYLYDLSGGTYTSDFYIKFSLILDENEIENIEAEILNKVKIVDVEDIKTIANLDENQKKAAISYFSGVLGYYSIDDFLFFYNYFKDLTHVEFVTKIELLNCFYMILPNLSFFERTKLTNKYDNLSVLKEMDGVVSLRNLNEFIILYHIFSKYDIDRQDVIDFMALYQANFPIEDIVNVLFEEPKISWNTIREFLSAMPNGQYDEKSFNDYIILKESNIQEKTMRYYNQNLFNIYKQNNINDIYLFLEYLYDYIENYSGYSLSSYIFKKQGKIDDETFEKIKQIDNSSRSLKFYNSYDSDIYFQLSHIDFKRFFDILYRYFLNIDKLKFGIDVFKEAPFLVGLNVDQLNKSITYMGTKYIKKDKINAYELDEPNIEFLKIYSVFKKRTYEIFNNPKIDLHSLAQFIPSHLPNYDLKGLDSFLIKYYKHKNPKIRVVCNNWNRIPEDLRSTSNLNLMYKYLVDQKIINEKEESITNECNTWNITGVKFEETKGHYAKGLKTPLPKWTRIPVIKGQAGFIGRFLPRDDPRVLFIGNYTDCCQKIGGQAEDVAIHSQTSPNAAVFIVEHNEEGIIAQSYTFNDNNKNVIFDNIEIDFRNSNLDYDYLLDIIINIYKNAANAIKSLGYENVFLGANNYDIDSDSYSRFNLEKAEKKYRDIKAPDYDGSYLLDSNDSKFKQCFQIKLTEELPIYQII